MAKTQERVGGWQVNEGSKQIDIGRHSPDKLGRLKRAGLVVSGNWGRVEQISNGGITIDVRPVVFASYDHDPYQPVILTAFVPRDRREVRRLIANG